MKDFSEDEARRIITPLENTFLQHLKEEGIFDIVVANPFTLGGIENTLNHPEAELAQQYTRGLIDLSRQHGISDQVIGQVVRFALEERKGRIGAGMNLESITEFDLFPK